MQFRRTLNSSGYSPSELLNSRQIGTKIDTLLPSPAHVSQGKQAKMATKSQHAEKVSKLERKFKAMFLCPHFCLQESMRHKAILKLKINTKFKTILKIRFPYSRVFLLYSGGEQTEVTS